MEAYCKAVRQLEEKFDGLELNHVLRKYNEATVALTKMASEWATVPSDVFVSDLHKPFINSKEDGGTGHPPANPSSGSKASMAPDPKAMDIEQEGPMPHDLPDWCFSYLQRLVDRISFRRFTQGLAAITQRLKHW
jgi:hypothetical protein